MPTTVAARTFVLSRAGGLIRLGDVSLDRTKEVEEGQIEHFLHEEEIEPIQIGEYKVDVHKRFVRRWAKERGLDPVHLWRVREECIAALEDTSQFDRRP